MAVRLPYIPSYITVHLGPPDTPARNVTVSFQDYVKNVACSEVYPTWEENALRANILAITSYALNRVYTEFYRARGYDFDITSSTAYDQQFVEGRNFFQSITRLVNELFDDYLRRVGFVEPLAAKFCNGTTVTCQGLSQWGSQNLARQGYNWLQILQSYYGTNTEIVTNAPVRESRESYPGYSLRRGSRGQNVALIQRAINRISVNYPAIPKLAIDGVFGQNTENAVREFQRVFGLEADGIVGRLTWYAVERIFTAVLRLSELYSEGLRYEDLSWELPEPLRVGSRGEKVSQLQYMLSILAQFVQEIPSLAVDGIFGQQTRASVLAFQAFDQLPETGEADERTWDEIFDQFSGIENSVLGGTGQRGAPGSATTVANARLRLQALGYSGQNLRQELLRFQAANNLPQTGQLTDATARAITAQYRANAGSMTQYPGYPLANGSTDPQ